MKAAANPNDRLAVEASGSKVDCDRDSAVEVSRNGANKSGDESYSSSDLQESATDTGSKSVTGNCLMCSDTEETAITSAHNEFWKKVWASCNIA